MSDQHQSLSIYQKCVASWDDGRAESLLECVADRLETIQPPPSTASTANFTEEFLLILAGALVFFMQTGFAMLCAGCVRKKNAQNTMLKNLLDACGAALAYFTVGYAFAFGGQNDTTGTTFIGSKHFFNIGLGDSLGFWFFQYTFSAATVTIVAGTLAERCQMTAYLLYSMFLTGFVYPVVAHAVWSNNGFLSTANVTPFLGIGMVDFAGSGVVHLTGGVTALFATLILGSRRGRFFDVHSGKPLDTPAKIKGHSVSLQLLGTMCLWFGWYGFNPGSALLISNDEFKGDVAARAAVNTSLSASAGGIAALFFQLYLEERKTGEYNFDLQYAMNGLLSGLVAVTAACGTIENWAAVLIGVVAGILYVASSGFLIRLKIDDAVDAIPVHMFNGIWGVVAVGLFSSPTPMLKAYGTDEHVGWFYSLGRGSSDARLLGCQLIGIIFIVSWTFILMIPFFLWLNFMGWFRTESVEELVGLDMSYHGRALQHDDANEEEEMKDEYLDAYERYKNNLRKRRGGEDGAETDSKEISSRQAGSEQSSAVRGSVST